MGLIDKECNYWDPDIKDRHPRRAVLRGAAIGGLGLAGAGLLACSGAKRSSKAASSAPQARPSSSGKPQPGGTFTAYMTYNAPLDPQKVSANPQLVISGVMSRLFTFKTGTDPNAITNHDVESDLGLSAETPDGVTWTVKLRPNAKFHNVPPVNGHAVESEDIKASFTRALSLPQNPNRGSLTMIDPAQIQTPDRQTVVFKLTYPYAPFQRTLASPAYSWIFPREVLTGGYDPSKVVIGSGPFLFESFTPDVAYVYKRNPAWYLQGRPYVDGMRVAVIPSAAQRLAQFSAGNLDEYSASIDDVATARQRNPKATLLKTAWGSPEPISLQLGDPSSVFRDIRVRQALSMAINRDALGKAVFNGEYVEALYVPAYMGKWAITVNDIPPDLAQYYQYNPAEAKKLLDAAGVTERQFKFAYVVDGPFTTPEYVKLAEGTNSMLNAVGIKSNIITHDYNKDYIDKGKGSSQGYYDKDIMLFGGISVYTEADEFLFNNFDSKSTSGHLHLHDSKLDAMIAKERTILNETERLKAVREIEQYIAAQLYTVPTVGPYQFWFIQPRVQHYEFSSTLGKGTETYAKLWLAG